MGSFCIASLEVVLENSGNNDMQCMCTDMMQGEDGKLQSYLECPIEGFDADLSCFVLIDTLYYRSTGGGRY